MPDLVSKGKSLFVSVGDPSADRYVARVIHKLREQIPELDIWGMGGPAMAEAGAHLLYNRAALAIVGIIEVLKDVPALARIRKKLLAEIQQRRPSVVLLSDFSGFNLGLAKLIRKQNKDTPILYFISPQVWASRPWRIKTIAKSVSKMLVIFPFEETLFKSQGIEARFVGHPLTSAYPNENSFDRNAFAKKHGLDQTRPIIGVFPGSRKAEIKAHAEAILNAIDWLVQERPELQFVIAAANDIVTVTFEVEARQRGFKRLLDKSITMVPFSENYELMFHSTLLWTKSGTTTLEAALAGRPMLIFYRGLFLSYVLLQFFLIIKNVGWPNILYGNKIVPELLQISCRAEQLVRYTRDYLDVPGLLEETAGKLRTLRSHLGSGDFIDEISAEILAYLNK